MGDQGTHHVSLKYDAKLLPSPEDAWVDAVEAFKVIIGTLHAIPIQHCTGAWEPWEQPGDQSDEVRNVTE
jgi:hypothetical protein